MVQRDRSLRKFMAGGRADELVLAGSAPTSTVPGDPISHIHRGTSFIVLVDGAIVIYMLATVLALAGALDTLGGSAFMGGAVFGGLMVYSGYRQRRVWAYWPAVVVLVMASLLFATLAFINLLEGLLSGQMVSFLFVFLMGWASFGSGRRALFHWHPGYRSGYLRQPLPNSFELADGEMLAACPSCMAVLAIQPTMLGRADRCPHCSARLVSQSLMDRYNEDE